jgi:hypothetical protein
VLRANEAYDAGDYVVAAGLYDQLIARGVANGHVYYNRGNALLRSGRLGAAIASYLEARALAPRSSDVRANLEFARKAAKDAIAPQEPAAALRTLFFWHYSLSRRELYLLLLLVNLALWTTLAVHRLRRESELLRWASVLLAVVLLAVGTSAAVRTLAPREVAVVAHHEVEVRSGTSVDTVVRFKLHEGTEARVIEREPGFVRLRLSDGKEGWVASGDVIVATL